MTGLPATWVEVLADWSLRWSVLIGGLMIVLAVRPPRTVAVRLCLAHLVLIAGLLLPLSPQWWTVEQWRTDTPIERQPAAPAAEPVLVPVAGQVAAERGIGFHPVQEVKIVTESRPVQPVPELVDSAPALVVDEHPVQPPAARTNWSVVLAILWLTGCAVCVVRLTVGRWWLARIRRAAAPVEARLLHELEAVRHELSVRRAVALLKSSEMAGPALFGGWRPAVVVPLDWATLSAADRRAALLHELTHVAHADDWAGLANELVRAAFFFHPLVHWLLSRLARERERRCDAAAVERGVAPCQLARLLLEGAKRLGPGRSVFGPRAAIPMFNRSSMTERIHQLLEADMTLWIKPLSAVRAMLATIVVLTVSAGLGGFGANAEPAAPPAEKSTDPKPGPAVRDAGPALQGKVKDANGPIGGATVLAVGDVGNGERMSTTSNAQGEFTFDKLPQGKTVFPNVLLLAVKDGFAPSTTYDIQTDMRQAVLTLPAGAALSGTVKDSVGRPVAGAEVQVGYVDRWGNSSRWGYVPVGAVRGTSAERFYFTKTDATGGFRFTELTPDSEVIFRVNSKGFAELDTGAGGPNPGQHVVKADAKPAALVLQPEALIRGRVTSQVPELAATAAEIQLEGRDKLAGFKRTVKPDAEGRFNAEGLPAGTMSVALVLPAGAPATAVGKTVATAVGETKEISMEMIAGVEVTGRVQVRGSGETVAGAQMATLGLVNAGFFYGSKPTTSDGQFTLRLPPGKVTLMVWNHPGGYGTSNDNRREVIIPADVAKFTISEPFEVVKVVPALVGRVTDAAGKPFPHVKVSSLQHSPCGNCASEPVSASFDGEFTLKFAMNGPLEPGRSVPLRIMADDGLVFEANALVPKDGVAEVHLPTLRDVAGPQEVKPDELAGIVVDENGKPLPGVKVHIRDWADRPENYTFTGADGMFRLKDRDENRPVPVRFRKDGYSPVMIVRQPIGVKGLVIALDRSTYFEGVVCGPDGKPAPGAVIRADQGPKMADGCLINHVWTETTADPQGRYRLYVEPDEYELSVKSAGVGVSRLPKTGVGHGQKRAFDISLQAGITFRATVVDSVTGRPAAGLRLYDWQHKEVDGRSDERGEIIIKDMLPGEFSFSVESAKYARWWSEQSPRKWEHKTIDEPMTGWQRNLDNLTFDLKPGMAAVTVVAEPAVRVTGRVLNPTGKPVAGATVAPALTGSGNSLTGDTRFSVETKPDGTFVMTLPASGEACYNLVAHDGKYGEWRTWANGVLPPVTTTPGQAIDGVTLKLTHPAVVRGQVVDAKGRPVAGREVRAHATDRLENRYYDPTTTTKADGTFELKFIRPAEQFIQVAPFWGNASDAPAESTKTLNMRLKVGQIVENVKLVAAEERP